MRLEELGSIEKSNDIGNRTRDLPGEMATKMTPGYSSAHSQKPASTLIQFPFLS
jgi:hypothetical protein